MSLKDGLFGEEGKVTFKNARTDLTFASAAVTFATGKIAFTKKQLYVTGHKVQLTLSPESGAGLPAPLAIATDYFVIVDATDLTGKTIKLAATEADALGGIPITLTDAGVGVAHGISLAEYDLLASCKGWNLTSTKAVVDTTTLSAMSRSYKGGLVDASGSMTIMFEADNALEAKKARKLFDAIFLPYDEGEGSVELYLSSVDVSDADRKITADVIFESGQFTSAIGTIIEASVNFKLNGNITTSW